MTPKHETKIEKRSDRELVITRTFNGPARHVFAAWTTPALMMRWWVAPSFGITFETCEIDARTGGSYRFTFRHPQFEGPMAFFGRYIEVVAPTRIVWTNEEDAEGSISTLTLEEADGVTHLTLHELFPTAKALEEALASGAPNGAGAQHEMLDALLATMPAA